jgi:hypothetical protein
LVESSAVADPVARAVAMVVAVMEVPVADMVAVGTAVPAVGTVAPADLVVPVVAVKSLASRKIGADKPTAQVDFAGTGKPCKNARWTNAKAILAVVAAHSAAGSRYF